MSVVHRQVLQLSVQIVEFFILSGGFVLSGFFDLNFTFWTGQNHSFFAIADSGHLLCAVGRVAVVFPVINVMQVLVGALLVRFGHDAAEEKIFEVCVEVIWPANLC